MNPQTHSQREAGSVMVLALLVTLLILGVGLTAMYLSSSGMKVAGNLTRRQEALSASDTGVERALSVLNQAGPAAWSSLLVGCGGSRNDPVLTKFNNTSPKKKGMVLCEGGVPLQDIRLLENSTTTLTGTADNTLLNLTYSVFVRNDDNEAALLFSTLGTSAWQTDRDKRIVLRVEGTARDSLSFFAVELSIVVPPPKDLVPCPYGQAGGCDSGNTNASKGNIS